MAKSLRDLSNVFGGMTGNAVKAFKNRQNRIDAAINQATGPSASEKPVKPAKKKRRTNSPYGGMYE